MREFLEKWLKNVKASDQKQYGTNAIVVMIESALKRAEGQDDPSRIIDEIDEESLTGTCRGPFKAAAIQRGDVFIHKLVGGKVRPWVVLKDEGDHVIAVSMSSSKCIPGAFKSQCRFWPNSWITPTITKVDKHLALEEVTRPYSNRAHLAQIEREIVDTIEPQRITSIAQILQRIRPAEAQGPVITQP